MDHSKLNNNELVNPGETFWKWMTLDDMLRV